MPVEQKPKAPFSTLPVMSWEWMWLSESLTQDTRRSPMNMLQPSRWSGTWMAGTSKWRRTSIVPPSAGVRVASTRVDSGGNGPAGSRSPTRM